MYCSSRLFDNYNGLAFHVSIGRSDLISSISIFWCLATCWSVPTLHHSKTSHSLLSSSIDISCFALPESAFARWSGETRRSCAIMAPSLDGRRPQRCGLRSVAVISMLAGLPRIDAALSISSGKPLCQWRLIGVEWEWSEWVSLVSPLCSCEDNHASKNEYDVVCRVILFYPFQYHCKNFMNTVLVCSSCLEACY